VDNCRHCGGQGFKAEVESARLKSIYRKTKCGPLENEIVRLRAQISALENTETVDIWLGYQIPCF
jgi:hypothetical protein